MHSYRSHNLEHIKDIFEEKTGVVLERRRSHHRLRAALILAAVLGCLTVSTMASQGIFSSLDGDDLALSSVYEGNGIVSVQVENRSDKDLTFQRQLKLTRWTTSEEVAPISGSIFFENTSVPAHSTQIMTIDLSEAYDIEVLETQLTDDWYYLTLTNQNFIFGQDWFCSVDFADSTHSPQNPAPEYVPDSAIISSISEELRPYFEADSLDIQSRRINEATYVQNYTKLLEQFEEQIVAPVSPVLPGNKIALDKPYLTAGEPETGVIFDPSIDETMQNHLIWQNWFARDGYFKLVTRQGEYALQISALLPDAKYNDGSAIVPLFYVLTYEKASITDVSYAFVYGQLMDFNTMEQYKIYEDDTYVCYEVSALMYSDVLTYAEAYVDICTSARWDDESKQRLMNIYQYYRDHLGDLIVYR